MEIQKIVIGLVANDRNQYLISLRQGKQHLAGKWEFPGGKLEAGETPLQGLNRELQEEVGLEVGDAELMERKVFAFSDRTLELHFYRVTQVRGQAVAREGQPLRWASVAELKQLPFPDANQSVIDRL
ncbi:MULTISPECIES: 8-oxo-dGTP diphosphatase MutT [Ferrimonas]|uniref:8-oxo-dGTP diphosphatase MutT n=1 Tax=Ferrimonas TaxID=44011 RepID=UPI00040EE167|nr:MULTISPECIES: 8-oxo-dGTP diphosphatase MutT [Ferrimonas]USD37200.1 8-oxo-dGTP diphosphatase MutT [Ferrimonas sp. SCSIO 43195]